MPWNYMRVEDVKFHAPPAKRKILDGSYMICGICPEEPYTPERLKSLDEECMRRRDEHQRMREQMTTKTFDVPSNKDPNKFYQVTHHIDGSWECSCPGYTYRKFCSHIEKMKEMK